MGTILQSTLNTRALPTGNLCYIRSDYPGKLTDQEVKWLLQNDITMIVDLREEKEYIAKPCRLEDEEGFVYYHLPVTGGGDTPNSPDAVAETYLAMIPSLTLKNESLSVRRTPFVQDNAVRRYFLLRSKLPCMAVKKMWSLPLINSFKSVVLPTRLLPYSTHI